MLIALLISCQQKLESPVIDVVSSDADLVCNDQLITHLTISGSNFAPLPTGVLTDTETLTNPKLWIERVDDTHSTSESSESDTGLASTTGIGSVTFDLSEWMTWTDANTLEVDIVPEFNLPSGTYHVHVQNPDGQSAVAEEALTVVAPPVFERVDPLMVCVDGRSQNFWAYGEGFLTGESSSTLAMNEGEESFDLTPITEEGCVELNGVTTQSTCTDLEFTLEDGSLEPGMHQGWLTNPDPAACETVAPLDIEAVSRPHLDEVIANFECVQQGEQRITLNGSDFIVLADGTTPMVAFGDYEARADVISGCEPLLGAAQAQTCTQMELVLPEDVQDPGVYAITVTNPAPVDCISSETVEIELLPTPTVTTLTEQLECSDQSDQTMSIEGTGFLRLTDGTTPTIQVGESVYNTTLDNCEALTGPQGGETCTSLQFTLPQDSVIGVHDVTVINPNSSECISEEAVQIEVVGQPFISSITEQLESIEQADQSMHITGGNFVVLADGTQPALTLSGNPMSNLTFSGCTALTGPLGGENCTDIDFTLTQNSLAVSIYDVEIVNPQNLDCSSEEDPQIELIGRPVVNTVSEDWSCLDQGAQTITLTGSNFLRTHNQTLPTVSVGSYTTDALDLRNCTDLNGPMGGVLCDALDFVLPIGAEISGTHSIVVNNPATAEAFSEEVHDLEITATPTLSAVVQNVECIDQSDKTMTISGSDFVVLSDGTTPTITVGNQTFNADAGQNCVALSGSQGGEVCSELTITLPQGIQGVGVYDITVQNPYAQTCTSTDTLSYELIAQPTLSAISESVDCIDQTDRTFTLTGTGFYQNASGLNPDVEVGGFTVITDSMTDCTALNGPQGGQICDTLTFTLPQSSVVVGVHDITVHNPENTCSTEETMQIETIEAPVVVEVLDSMECLSEENQDIVIAGTGFYIPAGGGYPTVTIDGQTETVTFASDCTALTSSDGQICDTLHVTLGAGTYAPGAHNVQVTNIEPAQCSSGTSSLNVAEAPVLSTVAPISTCLAETPQTIDLSGQHFIRNIGEGTEPTVDILGSTFVLDGLSNCGASSIDANFESCTDLSFTLDVDALPAGNHTLTLNNPAPADCSATISSIEVFEAPTLSGASASLTCIDQEDVEVTLYGADFVEINGIRPTVTVGTFTTTPTSMDGCETPANSVASNRCTQMTILVPAGALSGGSYSMDVTNPAGAECSSSQTVDIDLVGAPVITDVRPTTACFESPSTISVEIIGTNFVQLADGTIPTVQMGSETLTPTSLDNCSAYGNTGANLCTSIFVDLDLNNYNSATSLPVQILNPAQIGCNSNANFTFDLTGPPTITSVDPNQVCDDGRSFIITGTAFTNTSTVELDGVTVNSTFVDTEHIEVTLPADFGEGVYDIRIVNVDQCEGTAANAVEVVTSPLPFFVDPQVIYNGIDLQVTLFASDINDDVSAVTISDSAGNETSVSFNYDPTDPNRVQFTVPAGLPSDTYSVYLEDVLECGDTLASAFFIEDTLTVSVSGIDPAFGSTLDYTSVEVYSDANAGDTFIDVPRLYLNPTGNGLATELFGINFQNPEQLDAIIPDGLTAGTYDLIVVNPDGGVGVLEDAIEVIPELLPLVDTVSPGSFNTQHDGTLTIIGQNLDLANASMECKAGLNGTPFTVPASIVSGGSSSETQIQVDMNTAGITGGLVCVVTVENNSGALARYSSVSITSPSGNLAQFYAGPSMNEPRRGAPSAVGRASYSARYIYVMGGDKDGLTQVDNSGQPVRIENSVASATVEYAQVNRFGEMQAWNYLPTLLPVPRSLTSSSTIGRFIYIPGGFDGSSALADVHRTKVLDPLQSPRITSVDLNFEASTLDAGTWIYRVSAIYDAGYEENPNGESLASDPFVIRLPDLGEPLSITLDWQASPNASGYNIYRSPIVDSASGTEELLATVGNVTSYTDIGGTTSNGVGILPQGSLGGWATLPSMNTPRYSACIATAQHPTDDSKYFIYVAGGVDDFGNTLDSIEFLEVTVIDEHDHEVAASWTMNNLSLGVARSECGSFVVDNTVNQYIPADDVYVYFGSGTNGSGSMVQIMEAGMVASDGQLVFSGETTTLTTVSQDISVRGYFYGSAGGYLYAFGGKTNNPYRSSGVSAKLCGPEDASGTPICNGDDLPETQGWNNLGISMAEKRYLPSVTQESSVFFILGGEDDNQQALNTVEWIYY